MGREREKKEKTNIYKQLYIQIKLQITINLISFHFFKKKDKFMYDEVNGADV